MLISIYLFQKYNKFLMQILGYLPVFINDVLRFFRVIFYVIELSRRVVCAIEKCPSGCGNGAEVWLLHSTHPVHQLFCFAHQGYTVEVS